MNAASIMPHLWITVLGLQCDFFARIMDVYWGRLTMINRLIDGEPARIFASRLGDFQVIGEVVHYLLVVDRPQIDGTVIQETVLELIMPLSAAMAGNQLARTALTGKQPMEINSIGHVRSGRH